MKKYVRLLMGLLIAGWWSASCSSDHDDIPSEASGKGGVRIGLSTDTGFSSRAVDESYYADKNNYTVQILKDGKVVEGCEYKYSELPDDLIELSNGSYVLKAFCGAEKVFSKMEMYVVGETPFTINSGQVIDKVVECALACARISVAFDPLMKDYFSLYSVMVQTNTMKKGDGGQVAFSEAETDPYYFKVGENETVTASFLFQDKNGNPVTIKDNPKTYTLSPKQALKIKVAPKVMSTTGDLGITININEETNDKEVDILIPAEWMN